MLGIPLAHLLWCCRMLLNWMLLLSIYSWFHILLLLWLVHHLLLWHHHLSSSLHWCCCIIPLLANLLHRLLVSRVVIHHLLRILHTHHILLIISILHGSHLLHLCSLHGIDELGLLWIIHELLWHTIGCHAIWVVCHSFGCLEEEIT